MDDGGCFIAYDDGGIEGEEGGGEVDGVHGFVHDEKKCNMRAKKHSNLNIGLY